MTDDPKPTLTELADHLDDVYRTLRHNADLVEAGLNDGVLSDQLFIVSLVQMRKRQQAIASVHDLVLRLVPHEAEIAALAYRAG
ncbi:hypothetical protein MTDSW087_05702 [Methylobacterium dankookense]|uniref:Uncharacterized protein n=2 Tax=Methylobacterium dankookense TaxID=560405 RepID=A0A564G5X8_9HYPH|nr:hypothetical protein IFDJLNFL_5535 [Methylobacterium dankookense]VUF15953.1 hypothetical protein MTDSW087_05702 [Methylobacterium dankookense]